MTFKGPRDITRSGGSTLLFAVIFVALLFPSEGSSQILAPHEPLRILIVSDEVNPHGLSDEDLTQPGEISAALLAVNGLNLDHGEPEPVREINTDNLDQATLLLELGPDDPAGYDVLIYFAHRIPNGASGQLDQNNFVAAVEQFLIDGGGVVSFHHGLYETAGKNGMQSVLGAAATGSVPWNTVDGQNVIAVNHHFVANHGLSYTGSTVYSDLANGVPADTYQLFNNTPDERYPQLAFEPDADDLELLFASDYDGASHVLGYTHHRPAWAGIVVAYQPGEYQPAALGLGNNFQILLNAIVYAATYRRGELLFGDGFESGDASLW